MGFGFKFRVLCLRFSYSKTHELAKRIPFQSGQAPLSLNNFYGPSEAGIGATIYEADGVALGPWAWAEAPVQVDKIGSVPIHARARENVLEGVSSSSQRLGAKLAHWTASLMA